MPRSTSDPRSRATPPLERAAAPAPTSRRRLLAVVSGGLAAMATALLAGCGKPVFDRDRGVFVFRRPEK